MKDNNKSNPSTELYSIIIDTVVENENSPYNQLMRETNNIDTKYFDKISCDTETLSKELSMDFMDEIIKIFNEKADKLLIASGLGEDFYKRIQTKAIVIENNKGEEESKLFIEQLSKNVKSYAKSMDLNPRFPKYMDSELNEKYEAAKRITIKERILQNNKADVIAFHHALQDRTWWECRYLIVKRTQYFLIQLAKEISKIS